MQVPFLEIKNTYQDLQPSMDNLWNKLHSKSHYILGEEVENFEKEFADFLGVKYAIGVGNGFDALTLSLKALNIGAGDEVIVPVHTFIATWLAVSSVGAKPVPVDVQASSFNIDSTHIEQAITKNTKAIIPVHLYGSPAEMEIISNIAKKYNLAVLEDAAQAVGGSYKSRKVGSLGDIAGFSFYPSKNLGCFGDGGAVVTNDDFLYERVKLLRNYGSHDRYYHEIAGINSRLDELQAGILSIKLKEVSNWNRRRSEIANFYSREFKNIPGLIPPILPDNRDEHVWHLYVVRCTKRNELKEHLLANGIHTQIHYPCPPHLQKAYQHLEYKQGDFPVAEKLANEVLSLPIGPHLSQQQAEHTVRTVKEFFGGPL